MEKSKYCSRDCYKNDIKNDPTVFRKGHKALVDQCGEKNTQWKGNDVGYSALHKWINKWFKKNESCEECGKYTGWLDWANVSHEYKREVSDWMTMCRSCHAKYDRGII